MMNRQRYVLTAAACFAGLCAIAGPTAAQISISVGGPGIPGPMEGPGAVTAPMPVGTATILGRAIEAGTTRPVPGALVTLSIPGAAPARVMADAQGQFAFRDLPAGRFSITASRPGFSDGAYGRQRPGGPSQPFTLAADQHSANVVVPLWKQGVITGRIVDEGGEPVVSAAVRVLKRTVAGGRRQFAMSAQASTDDRGIYRFGALEPSDYLVAVPMTQPMSLDSMMMLKALDLPRDLPPSSPAGGGAGAATFAVRVAMSGNDFVSISSAATDTGPPYAGTTTEGRALAYATEFYPSAPSASRATAVSVAPGEERAGIDFQLKPVRAVNLSGRVIAPGGQAPSGTSVTLLPADVADLLTPIEIASAPVDATGGFRFSNVPSGQYTLHVLQTPRMAPGPGDAVVVQSGGNVMRMVTRNVGPNAAVPPLPKEPTLWADMTVNVGAADVADVSIPLRAGFRVSGRVEFNGSIQPPAPEQLSAIAISLEPADGRTSALGSAMRGRVEPDGTLTTMGVPAGKYVLRVSPPGQWALKGAMANGQDISDRPIELDQGDATGVVITFTDRVADVRGTVTASNSQPDASAAVVLFPTDRAAWAGSGSSPRRQRNVRTGADGSYSMANVPPGDYFIAAVSDAATADWPSAEFLAALSRTATRITVQEGERKQQALTTGGR